MRLQKILMGYALALTLVASATPANAAENGGCELLAGIEPRSALINLFEFRTEVLGLDPERWTSATFQNFHLNMTACAEGPEFGLHIDAAEWTRLLASNGKMDRHASIADFSEMMRSALETRAEPLPLCSTILDFRKSKNWQTHNAATLFGQPFDEMTPTRRGQVLEFIGQCREVLSHIAKARRVDAKDYVAHAEDLIATLTSDLQAVETGRNLLPEFQLERDGQRIYLAHTSSTTQDIVSSINTHLKAGTWLASHEVIAYLRWADKQREAAADTPDGLYAEAVSRLIGMKLRGQEIPLE